MHTQQSLINWWMKYTPEKRISDSRFVEYSEAIRQAFTHVHRCPYYNTVTGQIVFSIALKPDDDLAAVEKELRMFLPQIKLVNGSRNIVVNEESHSQFGMYELREFDSNDVRLVILYCGVPSEKQRFTSWADALSYVQRCHPWRD